MKTVLDSHHLYNSACFRWGSLAYTVSVYCFIVNLSGGVTQHFSQFDKKKTQKQRFSEKHDYAKCDKRLTLMINMVYFLFLFFPCVDLNCIFFPSRNTKKLDFVIKSCLWKELFFKICFQTSLPGFGVVKGFFPQELINGHGLSHQ